MKITEVYVLGALVFAGIFCFARQSIEQQQINVRISRLAEMKMALIDDLHVQEVEIASLESVPRIERVLHEMNLPLRPATQQPIVVSVEAPVAGGNQPEVELARATETEDRS